MIEFVFFWTCNGKDQRRALKLRSNASVFASAPARGDEFEMENGPLLRVTQRRWSRKQNNLQLYCELIHDPNEEREEP